MDRQQQIDLLRANLDYLSLSRSEFASSMLAQYDRRQSLSEKQWDWIGKLAEQVLANVQGYARRTGRCVYCRRRLTTRHSVELGYGPVCAENNHLPY